MGDKSGFLVINKLISVSKLSKVVSRNNISHVKYGRTLVFAEGDLSLW